MGLTYNCQLKVLNGRFTKFVTALRAGQHVSGRHTGSELAYHWVAHRKLMVFFDRFNSDLLSPAAVSVMTYVTPYNIYLLTAFVYSKETPTSGLVVDKLGLGVGLAFQVAAICTLAAALCFLVDRLHESARAMHGLQLLLCSDKGRWMAPQIKDNSVCEGQPRVVVALHTKWKLFTHYQVVHTEAKHFFTIGTFAISKKSCYDVSYL